VKNVGRAAYRIATRDDVAIALRDLDAGESIDLGDSQVTLLEPIPRGHKFAVRPIATSQPVCKYGWPIGRAKSDIAVGAHVHTHNVVTRLSGLDEYRYEANSQPSERTALSSATFMGYRRATGKVGTRNEIWILCTVGCVARTAERIARIANQKFAGRVDGIHAFTHQFGCSQLGGDLDRTRKLISALA
jgi:altronate hydrolase